ncbi:C-terminal binding protein [Brevibacterium yomogidense]|uniref:C-terminal binding protein n=1 Tax=Brevibacterium yomogidense TaxID=946573 RepID=UPI0018DFB8DD|nr:C-terminal binding protein [Brevibacterium yomogidense]
MGKRVVITDQSFPDLDQETAVARSAGAALVVGDNVVDEDAVVELTEGADVVMLAYAPITERVLDGLSPGATVIRYGIGFETIDVEAATRRGVRVCNVPDYGADTVADHTVALALASLRRIADYHAAIAHDDGWISAAEIGEIPAVSDVVYGLIGTGQIGRKVARRMAAFGAEIIAYDPYADSDEVAADDIELVEFDVVIANADIVSVHAPLTPETHHIVDRAALEAMKDTAVLVNTARGALVDTRAAAEAVAADRIGALALDVMESEPLEAGHPLRTAPRTLLTPHAAFYSARSLANLQRFAAEEMGRALRGDDLRCQIN